MIYLFEKWCNSFHRNGIDSTLFKFVNRIVVSMSSSNAPWPTTARHLILFTFMGYVEKTGAGMYEDKIKEFQNYFKSHNKSKEYLAHSSKVHSVGWSCDGRRLASGSFDKTVCIYTLDKDKLVGTGIRSIFTANCGFLEQRDYV